MRITSIGGLFTSSFPWELPKYGHLYFKVFIRALWLAPSSLNKSLGFLQSFSLKAAQEIVKLEQINKALDVISLRAGWAIISCTSGQEVEDLHAIGFDKALTLFKCIGIWGTAIPRDFIRSLRIFHEKMPHEEQSYLRYLNVQELREIINFITYLPDFCKILTSFSEKETFTSNEFEVLMRFFISCCDRESFGNLTTLINLRHMLEIWDDHNLPVRLTYNLFIQICASKTDIAGKLYQFSQWCLDTQSSLLTQQALSEIVEKSPCQRFIDVLEQLHKLDLADILTHEHLSLMFPQNPTLRESRNHELRAIHEILPRWVQSEHIERLDAQRLTQLLQASQSSLDSFNVYLGWIISADRTEHCTIKILDWYLAPEESSFHRYLYDLFAFFRTVSSEINASRCERFHIFLDLIEMKAEQKWESVAQSICIATSESEIKEIVWYWNIVKKTGQLKQFDTHCITDLFKMCPLIETINNLIRKYMTYQQHSPLTIEDLKKIIGTAHYFDTLHDVLPLIHKIFEHTPEIMTQQLLMRFFDEDVSDAFPDFLEKCGQHGLWDVVTTEDLIQVFEYSYDGDSVYDSQGTNYHCKALQIMHEQNWGPKISSKILRDLLSLKGIEVKDLVAMLEFLRDKGWLALIEPSCFNNWVSSGRLKYMTEFFQLILKNWSKEFDADGKRDLIKRLAENLTPADMIRKIISSLMQTEERKHVNGKLINTLLSFNNREQLQGVLVFIEILRKIDMTEKFCELLPDDPLLYMRAKVMGQLTCDVRRAEREAGLTQREVSFITLKGSERYPIAAAIYSSLFTLQMNDLNLAFDFLQKLHVVGTEYITLDLMILVFKDPRVARFFISNYKINKEALRHILQTQGWKALIEKQHFGAVCEICQEFRHRRVFLSIDEINNLYDCQDELQLQEMKRSLLLENAPDYELEVCYNNIHSLLKLMQLYRSEHVSDRGGIDEIRYMLRKFVSLIITHSQHLKVYEAIAECYLEGCVNQPVRGFSEICAYLHIAEEKGDLNQKIESFRYLYALKMVQSYVTDTKPEELFEAEAANALISRTYLHWMSVSWKLWPGIPSRIVNYGGVHEWLMKNEQNFEPIKQKICSATTEDLKDFALNQTSVWLWAPILFPEDTAALEEQYEQLISYMAIEVEYQIHQAAEGSPTSFETFIESYSLNDATKRLYLSQHQQSSMNSIDMKEAYQRISLNHHNQVSEMARSKVDPALACEGVTTLTLSL